MFGGRGSERALFPEPVLGEGLLDRPLNSAHGITRQRAAARRRPALGVGPR